MRLVAEGRLGATTSGIAGLLGAAVGSIYHRFGSRDLLLARLWIRTIQRFRGGFIRALRENAEAAMAAALYNVGWSHDHPKEARVMLLYRREELAVLNTDVEKAVMHHALRRYGKGAGAEEIRRVVFALVDVPYAAGRRHLINGEPPPPLVDELVIKTLRCVLWRAPNHRTPRRFGALREPS